MIAIVVGTRPEIIKLAPLVHEAAHRGIPYALVHSGQHYSPELDRIFFEELSLPAPTVQLSVGSLPPPEQIGKMMEGFAQAFRERPPTVVVVQGDTNTVLAAALVAFKMNISVAHVEAGLRSDDWTMPEEANRVLTDRLSRWLFCPTELQRHRLASEGIAHAGVQVVGNTIVDAVKLFSERASVESRVRETLGLASRAYVLLTLHRPGNVDNPERLRRLLNAIAEAGEKNAARVIFPLHPRTRALLEREAIVLPEGIQPLAPVGYLDMLALQRDAACVLTDSGGLQEEACILGTPCVTLRPNTERPETVDVGANVLYAGDDGQELAALLRTQIAVPRTWVNPFGDGTTSSHILDTICL